MYRTVQSYWRVLGIVSLITGASLFAGCGGSNSNGGGGNLGGSNTGVDQNLGSLTARVVGTARPAVISKGANAGFTGIGLCPFSASRCIAMNAYRQPLDWPRGQRHFSSPPT